MGRYDLPMIYVGVTARLRVKMVDGTPRPVLPDGTPCIKDPNDPVRYFYGMLLSKTVPVLIAMRVGSPEIGFGDPLSSLEERVREAKKSDFADWAQQHKLKYAPNNLKTYAGLE
jgi:hypothetical protein